MNLARPKVYRSKSVASVIDLGVMRRIDELHLELPFYGSWRMTFKLNAEGLKINRKRVRRLMRVMGIEALSRSLGGSEAEPANKICLLRGLAIIETNHLSAADIEISMDGRRRFMDNIFIEHLWRSIKSEEIHQAPKTTMKRAGMEEIEAARVMDTPLPLEDARAPPTYPKKQQQKAA